VIEGKEKTHDHYREILRDNVAAGLEDQNVAAAYQREILSRLSSSREIGTFTEAQMLHTLADIFGAGSDTTIVTTRWFMLFMAVHPEVQARIKEELDAALASRENQGVILTNYQ